MPLEATRKASGSLPGALADADLVSRCRHGDQQAWTELVDRFSPYVYAIVVRGFRLPQQDAEDVFQDVFARTYEKLDTLRNDASIRPFIAHLARRLAIDRQHAASRVEPRENAGETVGIDDDVFAEIDEAMTVREALATLPNNCRELLDRFFARDESYRTISAALEIPPGTIASRISRCLAKLRVELEGRKLSRPASWEG
jgi:RNA polymerase sigma factor (sigma-70 family)